MRLLLLCCLFAAALPATEIAGTDALADTVGRELSRRAEAAGKKVKVRLDGSLPARQGVVDGQVDLGILLLRESDIVDKAADGKAIRRFPLGAAAAYVYVHASNPLREVNLPTLAGIFGSGQRDDYKFWSDVPGASMSEPVLTFTSVPDRHIAQALFQGIALGGRAFKPNVRQRVDAALARESVTGRTNAILVSAAPLPPKVGKLLQVSDGREGRSATAYSPDETNIFNGDYPLRLPLVLCVREDRVAEQAETIRWLLSEEAAGKIREAGMIPAPKLIRDRLAQRLDSK
ncbi:MAG: PstS family phosphate ABC transporter substrate-binding protein [Opitutales bacterium]|jgi:ABC-type phosphate transport system substrate-binding protein